MPALILSDFDRGAEFRRWGLAAAIVLAGHFALGAGYWFLPQDEPEGAAFSPAIVVDFAPVPVAPASQQDLAPGPEMIESQPTATPQEESKPEVVEPVPKMETPAPAEVTLPDPKPAVQSKVEEKTETVKVEAPPTVQAAPAPRTTAAPRSDQNTAAAPAAPAAGSADSRAIQSWRDLVSLRLQQNKRYPAGAHGSPGIVTLAFTVDRSGHVLESHIVKSSGVSALDEEVLALLKRAEPLPAFPPAMTQPTEMLTQPFRFLAQ